MLDVTPEFMTAAKSNIVQPIIRVSADFTNVLYDPTISVTPLTGGSNRVSANEQVINDKINSSYMFLSCDGVGDLSGTWHPAPAFSYEKAFTEIGYWSDNISEVDGSFIIDPSLEIVFKKRRISGYKIYGDDKRNEFPEDFNLYFYSGVSLVLTENIVGNTSVNYIKNLATSISDVDKVIIEVTKLNTPLVNLKIIEVSFSLTAVFDANDIVSCSVLEQREISNDNSIPVGNIASNECSITLLNSNRRFDPNNTLSLYYGTIRPGTKMFVEVGFKTTSGEEYVPLFTGYAKGWTVPENSVYATVYCLDRFERLRKNTFTPRVVIENNTFYEWFETVLNDAGLSVAEYSIDTLLDGTTYNIPYGWQEGVTHRRALEILAKSCGASVYVDRYNKIAVESVSYLYNNKIEPIETYTDSDYMDKNNQALYESIVNLVRVSTNPITEIPDQIVYETVDTALESIGALETKVFSIKFTKRPVKNPLFEIYPVVTDVGITDVVYYAWGAEITVENVSSTNKNFKFKVTASELSVQGSQTAEASDEQSIFENGRIDFTFSGAAFLQKKELASALADILLRSYKDPEKDLSLVLNPGGNPAVELGDKIIVTDVYQSKEYNITSSQFLFDQGGLSTNHKGRFTGDRVYITKEDGTPILKENSNTIIYKEI